MIESLTEIFDTFHFLRPWWFLGLLPVVAVIGFYTWRKRNAGNWETIINPELLPFLLQGSGGKHALSGPWLVAFMISAWIFCCLGLAGPAWQQLPQPVHKQDSALVVVLDLSPSMLAEDISPNRLVRARYKLIDILTRRTEGVVGLIVYGGDSHTVSPLTEDSNTIVSMVPVLEPNLMPETGSNVEEGLASAIDLAMNGGYQQADILLVTDGIDKSALSNIAPIISGEGNYRLSILGVGTTDGAPIPSFAGGFIKKAGNVIVAKLNVGTLRKIAANNGGSYQTLSADDRDIDNLLAGMDSLLTNSTRETDRSFDLWDDQGYWLILLLLPVLLLSFRKGSVVVILIAPLLFTAQPVEALEWQDLWQTPDQQASEAMKAENYEAAKDLFEDSRWRGSAAFKAGDFDQAIADFSQDDSAIGDYNHGNSLAKAGDLEGAIEAYNNALSKEPKMADARFNLDLVEQLKDQQDQDQQNQEQQNQEQQDQDQQSQEQQDQEQQSQEQQDQDQQSQEQQDQDQQSQEQKDQGQEQQNQDQQNESNEDPAQTEQDKPEDKNEAATEEEQKEEVSVEELSDEEKQEQEAIERILRRIPDDPGGLLRAKFRHQSRQRSQNRRPPTNEERW
ncbi:MAG: VWA domain-containing protein [Porticoccaceae bacterium]|nr:VWA domain-containing protein [Porticoccaceae bacterium]